MDQETRLNDALRSLGGMQSEVVPEGFMDSVWSRAGEMAEAANARRRLALFAVIFAAGMGGGIGTIQTPAKAEPTSHELFAGADLSPAVLLHVEP
ncbi:hypothetical protein D6851_05380 [Altericroceibacterium spongiae]|uniref:Uncharacterized protein n=1 Tax=Altericroceibacterium spongiae TaxID=2320269 RepID=A0A420EPQ1_9SPHN|nr:hypothetical protein [Altericroceibacterium spongiae]RKF22647.1 hypothetical protein D6851_05380 [Altericroceibacterium spongiae]